MLSYILNTDQYPGPLLSPITLMPAGNANEREAINHPRAGACTNSQGIRIVQPHILQWKEKLFSICNDRFPSITTLNRLTNFILSLMLSSLSTIITSEVF